MIFCDLETGDYYNGIVVIYHVCYDILIFFFFFGRWVTRAWNITASVSELLALYLHPDELGHDLSQKNEAPMSSFNLTVAATLMLILIDLKKKKL